VVGLIRQHEKKNNIPACFLIVTEHGSYLCKQYFESLGVNCVAIRPVRIRHIYDAIVDKEERPVALEREVALNHNSASHHGVDQVTADMEMPSLQCSGRCGSPASGL
jgi:hypothetical protein